jgi:hypothetical protein
MASAPSPERIARAGGRSRAEAAPGAAQSAEALGLVADDDRVAARADRAGAPGRKADERRVSAEGVQEYEEELEAGMRYEPNEPETAEGSR